VRHEAGSHAINYVRHQGKLAHRDRIALAYPVCGSYGVACWRYSYSITCYTLNAWLWMGRVLDWIVAQEDDGNEAVLSCTNRENSVVKLGTLDALLLPESYQAVRPTNQDLIILLPGTPTRLVAIPRISEAGQQGVLPSTLQVQCCKQATWLESKLFELGIAPFTGTGFVVSVTLPPQEAPPRPNP